LTVIINFVRNFSKNFILNIILHVSKCAIEKSKEFSSDFVEEQGLIYGRRKIETSKFSLMATG